MGLGKLVIVAPEVFPVPAVQGGAVETWIDQVSRIYPNRDVKVLSIGHKSLPANHKEEGADHTHYQLSLLDRLSQLTYKLPFKQSTSFLYWWFYAVWCGQQCRKINAEVIHIHNRWQFVPAIRKRNPNAKIILHIHQLSALNFSQKQLTDLRLMIDGYASCSRYIARLIQERFLVRSERVNVISNGVDTQKLYPLDNQKKQKLRAQYNINQKYVVLYAGRLVENKGAHILIEALKKIGRSDVKVIIAGGSTYSSAEETEYISKLKKEAGSIASEVEFTGYLSQDKVWDYYRLSDIIAVPSLVEEALSMTLVEGMAAGCAPIINKRGGMPEIVENGQTGYIIDNPEDVSEWENKLNQLLSDDEKISSFRQGSRKIIEQNHTWKQVAYQCNEIFNRIQHEKKVAFVETGSGFGGTGKYLYDLLLNLDVCNISPMVVYSQEGNFINKIKWLKHPYAKVDLNYQTTKIPALSYLHFLSWEIFIGIPKAIRLYSLFRKSSIQLVYLNNEVLSHIPTIIAAKAAGCKIICHNHGHRSLTKMEKYFAKYIDQFICVSQATGDVTKSSLNGQAKITVIHNGIDLSEYDSDKIETDHSMKSEKDCIKVGMFGRIVEWKGQEDFIRAASLAHKRNPGTKFYIIGDDLSKDKKFLKRLKGLAENFGLNGAIEFTGWVDQPLKFIKGLDFVVQPSKSPEPFGFTVVEAMALERPVIGSRQGALPEIIDDMKNGLLYEPNNYQDLADKMGWMIEHKDVARKMGKEARVKVENSFTVDRTVKSVEKVILG